MPPKPTVIKSDAPFWVNVLYKYGVPAAIAMYLVYALVSGQGTSLKNIEATLQAQKAAVAEVAAVTKKTADDAEKASNRQEAYLRLICAALSKTVAERQTCLTVR